jgi:hypothetical protein
MKNKNIILAVIAFCFATGSAFATFFAPTNVWVRAKFSSAPGTPAVCLNTGAQCESTGSQLCIVQVTLSGGGTQTANSTATGTPYITYYSGCITALYNNCNCTLQANLDVDNRPVTLTTQMPTGFR